MRFRNKVIAIAVLFSLIFTSRAFVAYAETESSASETEATAEETTIEETESTEETTVEETESTTVEASTTSQKEETTVEETESTTVEASTASTEEETTKEIVEEETTTIVEATIEESTYISTESELTKAIVEEETKAPLFGDIDKKFRLVYFKEDMSDIDVYTFDYVGRGVIPDAITIAAGNLEALNYYDKRYNGVVDIGLEGDNWGWFRNNYKWDDARLYSEDPISLSDAYQDWCTGDTLEDKVWGANYAKLSEMTIVRNTIDVEYNIGEKFNPSGLKVDVKFVNDATATIEYSDSTKDHFKFYDNTTGDEYTTDTDVNADFTLKIVYGDVEHGSSAISTISATIDIIAIDPSGEKGFKVYCQKLDNTITCINYTSGTSAEDFTETVRQFINGAEVASDVIAYQGWYYLTTYSGVDYEPYRTWNDSNVFSFESEFENKVAEWIDGGKTENKSVGIVLQERQIKDDKGILYVWHLDSAGTIIRDEFTEIVRMDVFEEYIDELNNTVPSQYNRITGYYKDAYIDYQFYRPDRKPREDYPPLHDQFVDWKEKPNSFSFQDSKKICIAYERKTPDSISVLTPPSKVNYLAGEHFDPTGLVVLASYPGNINNEIPCDEFRNFLFSFDPATDVELSGANNKVTITCCNKSIDYPIYIEPEVASISICKMVSYDTYSVGEKIDPSGLSINVSYVGAPSKEEIYNDTTKDSFSFNPALDYVYGAGDIGAKSYTLTYRGKETHFSVNVMANNKFVVLYDVGGSLKTEVLEAYATRIERVLDTALQSGYTGFYKLDAVGYYDAVKKYDRTSAQTMTKDEALELFNNYRGTENVFLGSGVEKVDPPPVPPTPTPPTPSPSPSSDSGNTGGGSSSASVGPMGDLTKKMNGIPEKNNIPSKRLINDKAFINLLKASTENADAKVVAIKDGEGNEGFGQWLKDTNTNAWYFVAGDESGGNTGLVSDGWYSINWDGKSKWYYFDITGALINDNKNTTDNNSKGLKYGKSFTAKVQKLN